MSDYILQLKNQRRVIAEAGPVPAAGHFVAPVAFEVDSIRDLPGERFGPILHVVRYKAKELDRVIDEAAAGLHDGLLAEALGASGKSPWRTIVIDVPPALSLYTVNALRAADAVAAYQNALAVDPAHVFSLNNLAGLRERLLDGSE